MARFDKLTTPRTVPSRVEGQLQMMKSEESAGGLAGVVRQKERTTLAYAWQATSGDAAGPRAF